MSSDTTELDRMREAAERLCTQEIADFLDWCEDRGWTLCRRTISVVDTFKPVMLSREKILAEYADIDLDKIEQERRVLLDAHRRLTEAARDPHVQALTTLDRDDNPIAPTCAHCGLPQARCYGTIGESS